MQDLIADARAVFAAAVQGVQADVLVDRVDWDSVLPETLTDYERIVVVGMGKAGMAMASAVEKKLGEMLTEGCVVVPRGYPETLPFPFKPPRKIDVLEAGHPLPDRASEDAAHVLLDLADRCTDRDLLLVLISGGGSALTTCFAPGIELHEGQYVVHHLLRSGADIRAMNTVRKHISLLGGGRLARQAAPADVVALVISDVVGDDLSVIASGPTVGDPTRIEDAIRVLRDYDLWDRVPASIRKHLLTNLNDASSDTPKPDDPLFKRVRTELIGTNRHALDAACREATRRGYRVRIHGDWVEGEARVAGKLLARRLLKEEAQGRICHLWGGETTVTVKGKGLGGRNQELALSAAFEMERGSRPFLLLSGGTDGIDGPTDAAGAFVTTDTLQRARQRKRDPKAYLDANDAYTFFLEMNTLLKPGPTHTNVMDVIVGLAG